MRNKFFFNRNRKIETTKSNRRPYR
ncbi:unnamed protein product [Leptidea sinapis]|uniref:Uncharacterized protein n=1 Tax=Leptidea sinapis TaxID=189913 RepID=A0A5E4QR39_9NEOP|nr:unnamed protein product [Leptidea sinapis]